MSARSEFCVRKHILTANLPFSVDLQFISQHTTKFVSYCDNVSKGLCFIYKIIYDYTHSKMGNSILIERSNFSLVLSC